MASGYGTSIVRQPWGSGEAVGCVLEGDSRDCRYSLSEWCGRFSPLEDNDAPASWGARRGQVTGGPGTTGGWFCRSIVGSCCHRWTVSSGVDVSASWLEICNQECAWRTCLVPCYSWLAGLEAVVTNSVFGDEWITRIPASIGSIRVLQTWGVHPKAVKNVNWCWMAKLAAAECVAVGECGLDETAGDMELQEKVFKRQILIAHQLKKPLVLHLRGKTLRTISALYGRALALTTAVLHKRHMIYLHSFSAGQAEFQLWYRSFPELLVGCYWLTTSELSREMMLRSMPATVIALETNSPHLASRSGIVNSPFRIYEQAVTIGKIRKLPTSTVIECSNWALRGFYALRVGAQWLVFNVSARMTSEWINMENLHILSISGTLTRTSQE